MRCSALALPGLGASTRRVPAWPRAFLWVALEFAFLHFPAIGFPRICWATVATGNLAFVQLTSITGIFGLSLVVASYNALVPPMSWTMQMFLRKRPGSMNAWPGSGERGIDCDDLL